MCPLAFLCLVGMCEQLTGFLSLLMTPSALIFHDTVRYLRERCMLLLSQPSFSLHLDFFNHHSIPEGSTGRRNEAFPCSSVLYTTQRAMSLPASLVLQGPVDAGRTARAGLRTL